MDLTSYIIGMIWGMCVAFIINRIYVSYKRRKIQELWFLLLSDIEKNRKEQILKGDDKNDF